MMRYGTTIGIALILAASACSLDRPIFRGQGEAAQDTTGSSTSTANAKPTSKKPQRSSKARRTRTAASDSAAAAADSVFGVMNDTVGPLEVYGHAFTVLLQKETYGAREHVRRIQIRDEKGVVRYEERMDPPMRAGEPEWTTTVSAYALRSGDGQGLLFYYRRVPSATHSGLSVRVFAVQGGRVVPIAPRLSVYGNFADLRERAGRPVAILLPDELLNLEVAQGYFGIEVPFRVRLDGCMYACITLAIRRGDIVTGLSLLRVTSTPGREITADTSVVLFDAPQGAQVARVPVLRTSKVTIVEVAADVLSETYEEVRLVRTRGEWLHVRIDGRDGWIRGEDSFTAIGLKRSGSS